MNVKNRTIFCNDNLYVLRGIDTASVDLIYLDPPFNSKKNYAAPIGSEAAGAAFKDTWSLSDIDNAWHGEIAEREPALYQAIHAAELTHGKGMKSYLIMMAIRLLEMKRVLKETGSIYLHCDQTAGHYLKVVMDSVFGKDNFRNEMIWCYTRMSSKNQRQLSRAHDIIFWYSKSKQWEFNVDNIRLPYAEKSKAREGKTLNRLGSGISKDGVTKLNPLGKFPEDWITHIPYLRGNERVGYPTQKPLKLIERIIKASSKPGDVVLDPFCGCATTCVAAERLQREWIGIDISPKATELVKMRLEKEVGFLGEIISREDLPKRSEKLPNYRTHKHTLYGKQEGVCNGCLTHFPFRNMTIDHVEPRSKGGTDHEDNLQLLCGACNSTKGKGTQAELKAKLKKQGVL